MMQPFTLPSPFFSPAFPSSPPPFNRGSGITPGQYVGIKDTRRGVLKHSGHKNQHLYEPGFFTISSENFSNFRCVIAAFQCYKLFDRDRLAVALH